MKLLVINGPNLNLLGIREPHIYGDNSYADLTNLLESYCAKKQVELFLFQSNHEGEIVDKIQWAYDNVDGIIINAAAYTHTSVAILDALKAINLPTVEVHLTDISTREDFRHFSFVSLYAQKIIKGDGFRGYLKAIDWLLQNV